MLPDKSRPFSGEFFYRDRIPSSKSFLNRLLVLRSYNPAMQVIGDSEAIDVVKMKSGLSAIERGDVADCAAAGTVLRFLALRASRIPGVHRLTGSERLFARPQTEIANLLAQLGCETEWGPCALTITSRGWRPRDRKISVDRSISSQFASALALNAWGLEEPLEIAGFGDAVSAGYFVMTIELCRRAGMEIRQRVGNIEIPRDSKVASIKLTAEIDLSSAFAIAAVAAIGGRAEFIDWPEESLQPDRVFPDLLREMGCDVQHFSTSQRLVVARPAGAAMLRPVRCDLRNAPDLFPVLAVLCSFADGRSELFGAPQLAYKESGRIEKTRELLHALGRRTGEAAGGLVIDGRPVQAAAERTSSVFDPEQDHRLAMAAALASAAGLPIEILSPEVVDKSFPEFWSILKSGRTPGGLR